MVSAPAVSTAQQSPAIGEELRQEVVASREARLVQLQLTQEQQQAPDLESNDPETPRAPWMDWAGSSVGDQSPLE